MSDFSHIQDDSLRAVLEGRIAPMTNTLGGCINLTFSCLTEDMQDMAIPIELVERRHVAANEAVMAYNDGDNQGALDALCRYWSI